MMNEDNRSSMAVAVWAVVAFGVSICGALSVAAATPYMRGVMHE